MAERTPYLRASYDAVLTTPRPPTPPTTTGLPRRDGLSRCSTEAKNASRSRCITDASGRMAAPYRGSPTPSRAPLPAGRRAHRRLPTASPQGVVTPARTVGADEDRRTMTTTLTARGPEDLLAAVPVVLGFRPEDSLVMLTFGATRSFHARLDLPETADDEALAEIVDALLPPSRTHAVEHVAFVVYSADSVFASRLAATLVPAFVA